ncbi:transpeptidase family protein [Flavobacteriaceae bacterium]|nr:transpeptidase family protein [Flavobacteriaceae bacterium]
MSLERNILKRFYLVTGGMLLLSGCIVFKLTQIQFVEGAHYRALAASNSTKNDTIAANRGNIYANDGSLLATSVPKYDIRFDAKTVGSEDFTQLMPDLAKALSNKLGKTPSYYQRRLQKARSEGNRYLLLARGLSYSDYNEVRKMPLLNKGPYRGGLIVEQKTVREHPLGKIAERLVGNERSGAPGRYDIGLEGAYDLYLRGNDGHRLKQKIAKGQWKPVSDENELEPQDGFDVFTTIDINIQDIAHHALLKQLEYYEAEHGTVVVMDVASGAIKAVANLGRTSKGTYYEKLNYAVGESHEPGSTFKVIALAAALEDRVIDTATIVDTRLGSKAFYGRMITDTKGHGKISAAKALEVSSNIGLASLIDDAYESNPEQFLNFLEQWGLDTPLGLPITGEGLPEIPRPGDDKWSKNALPSMAYGYNLRLTPLQILTFYNAIANDGVMVKPQFVERIVSNNKEIARFPSEVINPKILSDQNLGALRTILRNIVLRGTGKSLSSEYFSMAGKTGTARTEYWMADWSENRRYISSFAGYFPADQPKYSCIVVIHKPSTKKGYYGADVTGPVFKRIAQKIYTDSPLRDTIVLGPEMTPQLADQVSSPSLIHEEASGVPDVTGWPAMDALAVLENLGLKVMLKGEGKVVDQSLTKGSPIVQGDLIIITLS